jgi:hypothetical protein
MVPKIGPARPMPLPKSANKSLAAFEFSGMLTADELLNELM